LKIAKQLVRSTLKPQNSPTDATYQINAFFPRNSATKSNQAINKWKPISQKKEQNSGNNKLRAVVGVIFYGRAHFWLRVRVTWKDRLHWY